MTTARIDEQLLATAPIEWLLRRKQRHLVELMQKSTRP